MAVVFRGRADRGLLEVRTAGRTLRLYVAGVLHSAWNPARETTGSVWDALGLAPWLAGVDRLRQVLVLGLGGGAAVQLIRRHLRPRRLVAVERDRLTLRVAQEYFGVEGSDVELHVADAVEWVRKSRRRFDLVVDDLFVESNGDPTRPRSTGHLKWWRGLLRLLSPGGMLVVNLPDAAAARRSRLLVDQSVRARLPFAATIAFRDYENVVVALSARALSPARFQRLLARSCPRAADRRRVQMRIKTHP